MRAPRRSRGRLSETQREAPCPQHPALVEHVGGTRLAMSCRTRDDTLSWNLSRVKQGSAIRAEDIDHRVEVKKVTSGTKTAASTRAMSDPAAGKTGAEKPVEKAVAGTSQEVRIAKSTKLAAEQSTTVKADANEQFKVGKTVTERAAEDAGVEALKVNT